MLEVVTVSGGSWKGQSSDFGLLPSLLGLVGENLLFGDVRGCWRSRKTGHRTPQRRGNVLRFIRTDAVRRVDQKQACVLGMSPGGEVRHLVCIWQHRMFEYSLLDIDSY
ncbi:Hypothetical protein SMAX5B_005334 [Scophthalmus maximus]|uniref:Uncharacterized protein n=1 Tax=Scophthalmus maximus TaxID=52904 RepID=A0A2U9BBC4_SCOMX|nr:Hypothetical protein SMAX5B_005334 [Scophthalmus maximus]